MGIGGLLGPGINECDPGHWRVTTPRLGGETVPCSISRVTATEPTVYRLAPAFVARLLGLALVGLALLLFVGTTLVALAGLPADLLVAVVLRRRGRRDGVGWWLRSRAWVLRCTDDGYRVRLVRGAGVIEARWIEVEDAVTTYRRDVACLELRLRDGRTTTIPVGVLDVDKDEFVRELQGGCSAAMACGRAGGPRFGVTGSALVACSAEASPSPVYGARLLSGFGSTAHRGFKSRRLRCASPRRRTAPTPGRWEPSHISRTISLHAACRSGRALGRRGRGAAVPAIPATPRPAPA